MATMVSRYSEATIVMSATGENTVLEDELCVKRAQLSLGRKVKDQSGGEAVQGRREEKLAKA